MLPTSRRKPKTMQEFGTLEVRVWKWKLQKCRMKHVAETCEGFVFLSSPCFSLPIPIKITAFCDHQRGVSTSHLELADLHFTFRRKKKKLAQRHIFFSSILLEPESRETENWECDVRTSFYCHICRPDRRNPVQTCAYLICAERKNIFRHKYFSIIYWFCTGCTTWRGNHSQNRH